MIHFNRSEKLAIYFRLLGALCIVLVATISILWFKGDIGGRNPQNNSHKKPPETTTEPTTELPTEEPSTEPPTEEPTTPPVVIDDSFFDGALFIGETRIAGLYHSGVFEKSDFLYDAGLTIGDVEDETFRFNSGDSMYIKDALKDSSYKSVFLMFGLNELGWRSDDYFIDQYKLLVSMIQENCPDATIYIQSVVYVTKNYEEEVSWMDNKHADTFNELLKGICDGEKVVFLDVNSHLTKDGYLESDNSTNGFQFEEEFMSVWKDALKKELQR